MSPYLAKTLRLLHVVGAFAAGERRLIEGDVADEIEGVVVAADLLGQFVEEDALARKFVDDGLLAVGVVPGVQEGVERGVRLADGLARVVLERFGDQLAVGVEVLDALGDDRDLDVVDVILTWLGLQLASARSIRGRRLADGRRVVRRSSPTPVARLAEPADSSGLGLVDLHRVAVEVRVGEERGGPLEVHDGEEELVVVLVDARAAADDLLELGHRLDALVEHDQLAGLGIDAGGHQLARWWR